MAEKESIVRDFGPFGYMDALEADLREVTERHTDYTPVRFKGIRLWPGFWIGVRVGGFSKTVLYRRLVKKGVSPTEALRRIYGETDEPA